MDLDADLIAAWAGVAVPARSEITSHHCPECDDIADFFEGKSWQALTDIEALRAHFEALILFAPAAFHYYLPAFMRATLRDSIAATLMPEYIRSTLERKFAEDDLRLFSPTQLRVVARFLRMLRPLGIDDELLSGAETLAGVLDLRAGEA